MEHIEKFKKILEELKNNGQYRVFNQILRERGNFPYAALHAKGAN